MLKIDLKAEDDKWLKEIAKEIDISMKDLAYMSIMKIINEYRVRKAMREYTEGAVSLGKAAEIAGVSKRKFMVMIEDFGIPLNLDARDFVKCFGFLSEMREYRVYKNVSRTPALKGEACR